MTHSFNYDPKETQIAYEIVANVGRQTLPKAFMANKVYSINAFNIHPKQVRENNRGDLILYSHPKPRQNFPEELIQKNRPLIHRWKTATSVFHLYPTREENRRVVNTIRIIPPKHICTGNYLICGAFKSRRRAEYLAKYLETKFVRFLISLSLKSMCLSKESFKFVPIPDFSKPWTDEELYEKYQLSDEQKTLIETQILKHEITRKRKKRGV